MRSDSLSLWEGHLWTPPSQAHTYAGGISPIILASPHLFVVGKQVARRRWEVAESEKRNFERFGKVGERRWRRRQKEEMTICKRPAEVSKLRQHRRGQKKLKRVMAGGDRGGQQKL